MIECHSMHSLFVVMKIFYPFLTLHFYFDITKLPPLIQMAAILCIISMYYLYIVCA